MVLLFDESIVRRMGQWLELKESLFTGAFR
jgi:hypothetical protein